MRRFVERSRSRALVLLDVRDPGEIATVSIQGAAAILMKEIVQRVAEGFE